MKHHTVVRFIVCGLRRGWLSLFVTTVLFSYSSIGSGQSLDGDGLITLLDEYASDVERAAAIAGQATFDTLNNGGCNPGGIYNSIADPNYNIGVTPNCSAQEFQVWKNTRELLHTANDVANTGGRTTASLGFADADGVSRALRWTAGEELASQRSTMLNFASNQMASVASRMNALRSGAIGFEIANAAQDYSIDTLTASNHSLTQQQMSDETLSAAREQYSKWGGFVNAGYGWGDREASLRENAFDYDEKGLTLGLDYRFDSSWVLGGVVGYIDREIDFDESADSLLVVDGGMDADGYSATLFGLYQGDVGYLSASLGYQSLDFDIERRIKYPSFNPDLAGANEVSLSNVDSDAFSASFGVGFALRAGSFGFDPYLDVNYRDIEIDPFDEKSSFGASDGEISEFNLNYGKQDIDSLQTRLGLRTTYVFTPSFGVVVPLLDVAYHTEIKDDDRTIEAVYGGVRRQTIDGAANPDALVFRVATEKPDDSWYTVGIGLSSVIRGGRQSEAGGRIVGGWQLWLKYSTVQSLRYYSGNSVAGGVRYEF